MKTYFEQCMQVKSGRSEVTQSCLTLSDPMNCSLSGSSVHGIFQARVLEWIAMQPRTGSCLRQASYPQAVACSQWKLLTSQIYP